MRHNKNLKYKKKGRGKNPEGMFQGSHVNVQRRISCAKTGHDISLYVVLYHSKDQCDVVIIYGWNLSFYAPGCAYGASSCCFELLHVI